ncbi:MAG: GIY-YIG nuclease family protein [Fibromonadales bacterium]|nr:GIY-YIG nuclease family protein [Fibromonadales bacterium]
MKNGIVYIVQNRAFSNLFKIGYTEEDSTKDRGLNGPNVPENFDILYEYKCNNPKKIEGYLHEIFKRYRYKPRTKKKCEFFKEECLNDAMRILKFLDTLPHQEWSEEISEEIFYFDGTIIIRWQKKEDVIVMRGSKIANFYYDKRLKSKLEHLRKKYSKSILGKDLIGDIHFNSLREAIQFCYRGAVKDIDIWNGLKKNNMTKTLDEVCITLYKKTHKEKIVNECLKLYKKVYKLNVFRKSGVMKC